MSPRGTEAHQALAGTLPPLVERAVRAAAAHGFAYSCRPEQGRLLALLAAGGRRAIAETGTGCGVGLAWLATGAPADARLLSVERDAARAELAAALFADDPRVRVVHGDWSLIAPHAPFDLLVLDGGGQGKGDPPADPAVLLAPGGTVVVDDFTPADRWPPTFDGAVDSARAHWLDHPGLRATELRLAPDLAAVVGVRLPPIGRHPAGGTRVGAGVRLSPPPPGR